MAFKPAYLCTLGRITSTDELKPQNGYYMYQTADTAAAVKAANYFDARGTTLFVGDIIACDCAGVMQHVKVTAAQSNGDAHVVVAAMSSGGNVMIAGQAVTVAASDTIATGLSTLIAAGASLDDNPVLTCDRATASIGDQAAAPVAGSLLLKTWKPTAAGDATPIAATTFGKKANWWAYGKL